MPSPCLDYCACYCPGRAASHAQLLAHRRTRWPLLQVLSHVQEALQGGEIARSLAALVTRQDEVMALLEKSHALAVTHEMGTQTTPAKYVYEAVARRPSPGHNAGQQTSDATPDSRPPLSSNGDVTADACYGDNAYRTRVLQNNKDAPVPRQGAQQRRRGDRRALLPSDGAPS